MIARLSSCSEAATGPAVPSRSISSRSSARWKEKFSRLSSSSPRALVDEVVGGLGDRELQVGDLLGRQRRQAADRRERQPGQDEVIRPRGDRQRDIAAVTRLGYVHHFGTLPGNGGKPLDGSSWARAAGRRPSSTSSVRRSPSRRSSSAHGLARAVGADLVREVVLARELLAVDRHDQVAARRDLRLALEGDLLVAGLEARRPPPGCRPPPPARARRCSRRGRSARRAAARSVSVSTPR